MNDKSAAQLERDAERARAQVASTAESIRDKMSPGQLIDEFSGLFSSKEGSAALSNLKTQIRDNPLPLTLVGAGLAWLMLGQGVSASSVGRMAGGLGRSGSSADMSRAEPDGDWDSYDSDYESETGGVGETMSDAVGTAQSMVGEAADATKDAARRAGQRMSSMAGDYVSGAGEVAAVARDSARDLMQREPLAIAAFGLAVGTAIGALLPSTAMEDEHLGRYRDSLRETAEDLLDKGMGEAKDVAAEAYQAIKDEADRQGSSAGEASVAQRVGKVVKSAATTAEEAVRERLGKEDEAASRQT